MTARILVGDALTRLAELPDGSVQTCVTSPPYWGLRDYGHQGQMGLEPTPDEYVANMVRLFCEVRRVLSDDGTLWLNLGDTYCTVPHGPKEKNAPQSVGGQGSHGRGQERSGPASDTGGGHANRKALPGLKHKDLVGIPWRVAFALQADGWWLRQDIIWHKPNPMPESVTDRCTKAHEYLFLLSKSARYRYNAQAISDPVTPQSRERSAYGYNTTERDTGTQAAQIGARKRQRMGLRETYQLSETRNKRSVWTVGVKPYSGAHFAVMPADLVEPCILAGSSPDDLVLDPFTGSGTVGMVALRHGRRFVGIELNPEYAALAESRIYEDGPLLNQVEVVA